ncbi:MAG: ribonuclease HII [Elusimicrobia bacterium]|nr:ribonuclease HII [Elusimicrobiota bacterium]
MSVLEKKNYNDRPRREAGLFYFDENLKKENNVKALIGIDEAGRGPLAGPVTACAVFIPSQAAESLYEINDSKKMSEKKREKLFVKMIDLGVIYSFSYALPLEIDSDNILNASLNSMKRAALSVLKKIPFSNKEILFAVDGPHKMKDFPFSQKALVDGDAKSQSIAAASIFAKTIRDRWMKIIDGEFPGYGFASHKGYGTAVHVKALKHLGPCKWHRKSFAPVKSLCAK